MRLHVDNMSCQHCIQAVTAALRALDPQAQVEVDLACGEVTVRGQFDAEAAIRALAEADYPARLLADADPV